MDFAYIISIISAVSVAVCFEYEIDFQLMMYQQNSYRNERYARWLNQAGESTTIFRLCMMVCFFAMLFPGLGYEWVCIALLAMTAWKSWKLATAKYKKPLVRTPRVRRILVTINLLMIILLACCVFAFATALQGIVMAFVLGWIISPWIVMAAGIILKPVENSINKRYYNEAASILASMPDLKIIGITGSYGKTSTKHYLHRILSEHFDTLMTPGSYNTTMGVIRTVREYLKPYNEVFIVEMGAKQPHDIKEICDLVHPEIGIITAVGPQHLESFKSIENVQSTKFELADALPPGGLVVVNNDFEHIAGRKVDNVACIRYGVSTPDGVDVTVKDIEYDVTGTRFTITGCGAELSLHTHLVGECNVSNLVAAVVVARHLGVPDDKIRYAVDKIQQVEHRLNVKRTPGGITIIDDAFNSNPTGSRMAMDVLAAMKGGKRIVITPGMIELGNRQSELNTELGRKIASSADVAIIVGDYNREALLAGIEETRRNDPDVHTVASFDESQKLLATIARAGDIVLYENDLPDTFK